LFFGCELDKGVLKGATRFVITDDFRLDILVETRKYEFQIFIFRHWIELADKEYIFWRLDVSRWQVSQHFQDDSTRFVFSLKECFVLLSQLVDILLSRLNVNLIGLDANLHRFFWWPLVVWRGDDFTACVVVVVVIIMVVFTPNHASVLQ
jgi:hypothetical protein